MPGEPPHGPGRSARRLGGRAILTAALVGSAGLAVWSATWPRRNQGLVETTRASIAARAAAPEGPGAGTARPAPPPSLAREPPGGPIDVRIDSRPQGARVRESVSGRLLGLTPYSARRDRAGGTLSVRLELDGFEEAHLEVPLGASSSRSIDLRELPGR